MNICLKIVLVLFCLKCSIYSARNSVSSLDTQIEEEFFHSELKNNLTKSNVNLTVNLIGSCSDNLSQLFDSLLLNETMNYGFIKHIFLLTKIIKH